MTQTAEIAFRNRETTLLSLVSTAHFVSHVHIMTLPALMPLLAGYFGVSFLQIGAALTIFNIVSLVVQAPMGFLVDRMGAWKLLILALLLGCLSFGSLAVTANYNWLLIAMALAGIANGVYHPADYALLSFAIRHERIARAFSIHTFAGFLGNAAAPPILLTTGQFFGAGPAFAVAGLLSGLVALSLTFSNSPHSQKRTDPPQPASSESGRQIFSPAVFMLTLLFVLLNLSASGIQAFAVTALVSSYNVDLPSANLVLTAFLLASAFGVLAGGILAERTHNHGLVSSAAMAISGAILAALTFMIPGRTGLFLAMTVVGLLSGMITPSRDMLVKAAAPRGAEGRVFGIVSTGFNIGGAISPVLFGWLVDHGKNQGVFGATAIFMILTASLTIGRTSKRPQVRQPE
ncbi:MAG TPA: MFS transporter [Afipia sp.]